MIPKSRARFFELQYIYEKECVQRNLNQNHTLALDFGVNHLVTAVSNEGRSFMIDGRKLKSVNQWFNKENAKLQRVKDKQGDKKRTTNRQKTLADKRNRQINDYMSKTVKMIINYCTAHDIGTLVVGCNETLKKVAL